MVHLNGLAPNRWEAIYTAHDDVIKWKHLRVAGHLCGEFTGHRWRGVLMFSLICAWINGWVNNCEAGDLRRYHSHYDVTIMPQKVLADLVQLELHGKHRIPNAISGQPNVVGAENLLDSWWRHQMETFSALLAICAGNSVPGEFPTQRPVTRSFDVYFDLRPDKRLSKQSWGWWFETLSHSLWRHRNGARQGPLKDNIVI